MNTLMDINSTLAHQLKELGFSRIEGASEYDTDHNTLSEQWDKKDNDENEESVYTVSIIINKTTNNA